MTDSSKPPPPSERIGLTALVEDEVAETHDDRLRKRTLTPLIWFYIVSNAVIAIGVFSFAIMERVHPSFGEHIITEKVVIALIGGNTVQIAAMIIAAFKGLFDTKPAKKKKGGRSKGKKGAKATPEVL